jgi:AI-2 transport protein TqsA
MEVNMELKLASVMKPLAILAAMVVVFAGMKAAAFIVGPLVLALLFVAVLKPVHGAMLKKKFPRVISFLLTTILFILIVVFIGWVLSMAISQTIAIGQEYGPEITQKIDSIAAQLDSVSTISTGASGLLKSVDATAISNFLTGFIGAMTDIIGGLIIIFLLFMFILAGGPLIMANMREKFGETHPLPRKTRAYVENLSRYFVLRTLVNAITGLGIGLACVLLGIPNAFLWALLTFVLSYIPYIGMFIACVPPGLLSFAIGGLELLTIFILICIIVNGLAEQIISPIVTGRGLSLSPMLVFVSFLFWGWLLGSFGYIVAVPMTLAVMLFLNSFEDTAGLASLFSNVPE